MKYIFSISLFVIITFGCKNQNSNKSSSVEVKTEKEKFVWDFNSENNYVYSFEQIINTVNEWGGTMDHVDTSSVLGSGNLKVKSKGNNKANFVLSLKIETEAFNSFKVRTAPQILVIPDIDAHGQFDLKRRNSDVMFDLIFPLPSIDLKIGESEKLVLEIPFNIMGSPLYVKGYNKLKYLKDIEPNIALIKSEFKIDKVDVPEEIKGEFACSFIGEAELEFNYEKKYFKSSKVDLQIKIKSKITTGENAIGNMDMNVESANKYDIQFVEIENK